MDNPKFFYTFALQLSNVCNMRLVYIVSAMYYPNGMAKILTDKMNWLAEHTNYEIWMIETERADLPHYYSLNPKIKFINFDLNFDAIYSLSFIKRILAYKYKERKFEELLTNFLIRNKPDITISTLRREINFLHKINDGSKKIGEFHFERSNYRLFQKSFFPSFVNSLITKYWQEQLIKRVKKLDKFVVLTEEDLQQWKELDNVIVIPNFIKEIPSIFSNCDSKKVIALGRYTEQKGFDLLIRAWKIVEERHPDWKLDIYGSGNWEFYQEMAISCGVMTLCCHPEESDVGNLYTNASIYVLSSRYEGFGIVLIEAQSYGLPVVAFSCPCGPKDIISDTNGILVENGNVLQLAEGIIRLIENQKKRTEMGTLARINAQRYLVDSIMNKWLSLFNEVLVK